MMPHSNVTGSSFVSSSAKGQTKDNWTSLAASELKNYFFVKIFPGGSEIMEWRAAFNSRKTDCSAIMWLWFS